MVLAGRVFKASGYSGFEKIRGQKTASLDIFLFNNIFQYIEYNSDAGNFFKFKFNINKHVPSYSHFNISLYTMSHII